MNTYKRPEIEVIKFEVPDVITINPSVGGDGYGEDNAEHDNGFMDFDDL
ncbi:MAG: hypothetical protein U0K54_00655 [Acutalibacteraceae bacterium]|nr:hypothetical protein [Acutalibacteraceae bacterium]